MELLSRCLLIAGLLMLSWQWATSMPAMNPPVTPTPAVINPQDPILQSIFEILPQCKEGEILAGKRCRRIA